MMLERFADRVGCAVSMMSDLERGKRDLTMHWMRRIAKVLKVQVGDLLNEKDNSRSLSAAEQQLLDLYAAADEAQRGQLLQMAKILLGQAAAPTRRAANQ